MKASTLVLLVATFAEIKQSGANSVRGLHRDPYGKAAAFLGGDIDDKCEALQCPDDPSELDCTIEEPIRDVNWSELSDEDRVAHREEVKARRERLVLCACCTDSSIEDLLPEREGSFINRGHGGGKRKFMKMMLEETIEDECDALSCPADVSSLDCSFERPERPDIDRLDLSLEEKMALREGAKSKFDEHRERLTMCVCCTDSSVEDLLPDRADRLERLQDLLDSSTSEDGAGEDDSEDSEDEAEEEDFVGPDTDEQVDTAVLLSQANSQEASVETQEFLLASSAGLAVASFSLAAVPLVIVMM